MKRHLALFISFLALGCASKNLHKNFRVKGEPPLSQGYVYTTRSEILPAGEEPVDYGGVLVSKRVVFLSTPNQGLEAIYQGNFQRKWQFKVKNGISSEPVLYENILYFGAGDGKFYALDAELGKQLWAYEVKAPIYSRATVSDRRVYFTSSDDVLYCLDASTGKWLWHYKRTGNYITTIHGNSTPIIEGGRVYVGFSDGYLLALNANDGNLQWEQKVHNGSKFTDVDAAAVVEGDRIYIPSYDGGLYALEKALGKIIWRADVGGSKKVLLEDKNLFLGSSDGHVYSLNKDTGRILWKFPLDDGTPTNLLLRQNYIVFGGSTQYLYVIHKGDGSLAYRHSVGLRSGFTSSPVEVDNQLYMLSKFGNLYTYKWNVAKK